MIPLRLNIHQFQRLGCGHPTRVKSIWYVILVEVYSKILASQKQVKEGRTPDNLVSHFEIDCYGGNSKVLRLGIKGLPSFIKDKNKSRRRKKKRIIAKYLKKHKKYNQKQKRKYWPDSYNHSFSVPVWWLLPHKIRQAQAALSENPTASQKVNWIITSHSHKNDWYLLVIHNFTDINGGLSVFMQASLLLM